MVTGWHSPLQPPPALSSFTAKAGKQTHSGIANALHSRNRNQDICGDFWVFFSIICQDPRALSLA